MTSNRKGNILFIYHNYSSFVRKDYEFLTTVYSVKKLQSNFKKNIGAFIKTFFKQLIFLIKNIRKTDAIYCWFADYHSFLPATISRIFKKKFYLVLGGYDVMYIPELNYGSFNNPIRGFFTKLSIKWATINLAVAPNLINEAQKRVPKGKFKLFPTGYDPAAYTPGEKKEDIVLTVALVNDKKRFLIKGLDRFIELAKATSQFKFIIVGVTNFDNLYEKEIPSNLTVIAPLKHDELFSLYKKSMYYAQFSRSEGLPNTICEAMLSQCIPIGVRAGGIPFAIGNSGIVVDEWDVNQVKNEIIKNMTNSELGEKARKHISDTFHIKQREKFLINLL